MALSLLVSSLALVLPAIQLRSHIMMAEGGPPQIDWQEAEVVKNAELSRGTMQLRLRATEAPKYEPGHIIGFELPHPETGEELKGPYTVTRMSTDTDFDIIYRVIPDGRKTPFMEQLTAGSTVRFGGRFGTPVAGGLGDDCDRFIGVATGAGIGPLLGYAEAALSSGGGPKIELFCGFRDLADDCASAACNTLAKQYPERFRWTPIISKPMACTAIGLAGMGDGGGAVAAALGGGGGGSGGAAATLTGPEPRPAFVQGRVSTVVPSLLGDSIGPATHFHLVGNGQFVVTFREGLLAGGVAEQRVTTEKYFNGKAEAEVDEVAFIADAIRSRVQA
jgi:ferredoxin-NADP reductase